MEGIGDQFFPERFVCFSKGKQRYVSQQIVDLLITVVYIGELLNNRPQTPSVWRQQCATDAGYITFHEGNKVSMAGTRTTTWARSADNTSLLFALSGSQNRGRLWSVPTSEFRQRKTKHFQLKIISTKYLRQWTLYTLHKWKTFTYKPQITAIYIGADILYAGVHAIYYH
jgi:hypothetical protein